MQQSHRDKTVQYIIMYVHKLQISYSLVVCYLLTKSEKFWIKVDSDSDI